MKNREKLDGASFVAIMFGGCFGNIAIVLALVLFAAGLQAVKYLCLND